MTALTKCHEIRAHLEAAMYSAGAEDMREQAANILKLSTADLLLMAGEMTTQELRTVRAVLNALEKKVLALPITPANGEQS